MTIDKEQLLEFLNVKADGYELFIKRMEPHGLGQELKIRLDETRDIIKAIEDGDYYD